MLSPKIFHLCQDKFGLNESYQEFHNDPLFCVLCDVLYLSKPEESGRIAKEFERIIKKYLLAQRHNFTEKTLKQALDHAQKHFLKKYSKESKALKVTALVLVEPPKQQDDASSFFYVVGVGDFKLFQVDKPSSLLFYDPETPKLTPDLSLKKRFQYLTHAIGQPNLKSSIIRIQTDQVNSLLLMSYGAYNALPEEKWIHLAADFVNKKNQIIRTLSKAPEKEHLKQLLFVSFDTSEAQKQRKKKYSSSKENNRINPYFKLKKIIHFFEWAFKVCVVVVLGLCILELTQNYPTLTSLNVHSPDLLKNPLREPDMQLNIRSLKKPVKIPFIKERAFIVDLKAKYDRQSLIIDKLNEKIVAQDRALRDLQIKTYYHTPTYPFKQETICAEGPLIDSE